MTANAKTLFIRQGHRAPAPDDLHVLPARPRLRRADRRAAGRGRERGHRGGDRGRAGAVPAVRLGQLALRAMGARVVTPAEAPELHAMIDRLCVQADLPKPKVAVADTRMPNAFALGRSPKNATVCATTGIMDILSPAELGGVMAHELAHVANRDVMIMTLAAFFATIAAYIVQFGMFFGGGGYDDDENP